MGAITRGALACLQLDVPQEGPAPVSLFFRKQQTPETFAVGSHARCSKIWAGAHACGDAVMQKQGPVCPPIG